MKRKLPLFLSTALLFGVVTSATSCALLKPIFDAVNNALGISISITNKKAVVGEIFKITVYLKDADGNNKEYHGYAVDSWKSTNTNIATVSPEGEVTCLSAGSCTIKFKSLGLESGSIDCTLTVYEKELTDIQITRLKTKYPVDTTPYDIQSKLQYSLAAIYQTGYKEAVRATSIDTSKVDTTVKGNYNISFTYEFNSVSKTKSATISIVDPSEVDEKITLERNIDDYTNNSLIPVTGIPCLPESKPVKAVLIPIKFTDSDNYVDSSFGYKNIKEDAQKAFFSANPQDDFGSPGWESVKTYYEKESRLNGLASGEAGLLNLEGEVSDWFTDTYASSYYLEKDENGSPSAKEENLQRRAVDWFFSTTGKNRKDYDSNGDGFLDAMMFMYARPDKQVLKEKDNIFWYHVAYNSGQKPNISNPQLGRRLWVSYSHLYPENSSRAAGALAKERTGKSTYNGVPGNFAGCDYAPLGTKLTARTFIHETGHMIGLDDYYSTTTADSFASGNTMQTNNIGGHDPYSLLLYNWAKPYIPTESTTIQLGDIQSTHEMILLSPEFNESLSPYDEYVLIELFANNGLNEFDSNYTVVDGTIDTQGVRIWHIDSRLARAEGSGEFSSTLVTDPKDSSKVALITDNSPNAPTFDGLEEYDKYQELYLIRNDESYKYTDTTSGRFVESYYFKEGSTFSLDKYSKQFVNGSTLNDGRKLNWTVSIGAISPTETGYSVTINLTKSV